MALDPSAWHGYVEALAARRGMPVDALAASMYAYAARGGLICIDEVTADFALNDSDRIEYPKTVTMEEHAKLMRACKATSSNGLECFTTIHLGTLDYASYLMETCALALPAMCPPQEHRPLSLLLLHPCVCSPRQASAAAAGRTWCARPSLRRRRRRPVRAARRRSPPRRADQPC